MAGPTSTTRRKPRPDASHEEEPARRPPHPADAVLALQHQAGNRAVTRMVQRLALGGQSTGEDRTMVSVQLNELPYELREELIGRLGAATIRNVITSRLLLTLVRALQSDVERLVKLLNHLDEQEVSVLGSLQEDYSDKGFAMLVGSHPVVVKRKIREQGLQGRRQPGMVVVAAPTLNVDDVILYAHVDYALSHVGGTVQFLPTANLQALDPEGTLYIVEHGNVGIVGAYNNRTYGTMDDFVDDLLDPMRGLPKDFKGKIKITTCYSAVPGQGSPSAVGKVKNALALDGRQGIDVIGAMGPSITNSEISSKYPVVDPARFNDALYVQEYLLGTLVPSTQPFLQRGQTRRSANTEGRLGLGGYAFAKFGTLKTDWQQQRGNHATVEQQAALAARLSKPFYVDFLAIAGGNGILLADGARKGRT